MNSMRTHLTLSITTPAARVFEGAVSYVNVPGEVGDFGVLPGHMPLISTLRPGAELSATLADGTTRTFTLTAGFAEVTPDSVTILAEAVGGV
jgi:F-type H+-transporting ATPase subunit epsilon